MSFELLFEIQDLLERVFVNILNTVGNKIWAFFNSLKLTLTVLLSLAVVSIIGTVVEQGKPLEFYAKTYGERISSYVLTLGFHDMYHAWWFFALLVFLAANIIVCTIDRFPQKWKASLEKRVDVAPQFIKNLGNSASFTVNGDIASVKNRAIEILRKKRYKIKNAEVNDGAAIFAWKGTLGRFGSDIVHVSLITILTGAIIGSFLGFKDYVSINENETVNAPKTGFQIRLDKFWLDYYESGEVKQYNSQLTVIENGKDVLSKQIWVNEPLKYKGVWFYQSNYGMAYDRIKEAKLVLKDKKKKQIIGEPFVVRWLEPFKIPGTNLTVNLAGFVSDFGFDEKTKQVFPRSPEHNNPAIQVIVYDKEKPISGPWLFLNYPEIFATIPNTNYDLIFMGYQGLQYTGLSMTKDPGTNIVWIGSIIMAVGFILAFFIFNKKVWVRMQKAENGVDVYIGGMINKNKIMFEKEFSEIAACLKAEVNK